MSSRNKKAIFTLVIGLALNIALGLSKLVAGILSDSMSVSSDALNNLSDAAVSVVTIVAVALASRAADHDHPYGHGRYEYIATFVLGAVIAAVGVEIFIGGIKRAVTPVYVNFDTVVWATLGASIAVKSFMAVFYTVRGRMVGSNTIKAAAVDSISDAAVTSVVLICAIIEKTTGAHIDGYASIAVSVFVIIFALRILKEVIDRLLGERPDPELVEKLNTVLLSDDRVMSAHDLIINDYGADKKIAEVDLVFPVSMSFADVHAACDGIEKRAMSELGVRLSVHADPFRTDDERLVSLCNELARALDGLGATAHEVNIDDERRAVLLDVLIKSDKTPVAEVKSIAEATVRAALDYAAEISVDYA